MDYNVSEVMYLLEQANELLEEAEDSLEQADYEAAETKINQAKLIAESALEEFSKLKKGL